MLITGVTGSFGKGFARLTLKHNPKAIRIFSRGEFLQSEIQAEFHDHDKLWFFIGDIREWERVYQAMRNIDSTVHATALKAPQVARFSALA